MKHLVWTHCDLWTDSSGSLKWLRGSQTGSVGIYCSMARPSQLNYNFFWLYTSCRSNSYEGRRAAAAQSVFSIVYLTGGHIWTMKKKEMAPTTPATELLRPCWQLLAQICVQGAIEREQSLSHTVDKKSCHSVLTWLNPSFPRELIIQANSSWKRYLHLN